MLIIKVLIFFRKVLYEYKAGKSLESMYSIYYLRLPVSSQIQAWSSKMPAKAFQVHCMRSEELMGKAERVNQNPEDFFYPQRWH